MRLHKSGDGFWKWMDERGYAVRNSSSTGNKYPAATAKCGAIFPKQALIGYLIEYCLDRGSKISFYYLTDMRLDDIYRYLVDIVTCERTRNA